ncbi:hypothetical protein [Mesorhizobium sp. B4-1-4]|uniref:hypothetical protein n=1 Tax=Mesorhizobium sp. B4-1-4 TaxID=2589888 RepID=UPI001126AE77|nr:hypothetical protein [Mesorhizobium sp. B4-1-4]UCI30959.1 hypothetical protein FJW03_24745 [Mesorhizobium sp. B4-1-4]
MNAIGDINTVGVIGNSPTGQGISVVFARSGKSVRLIEICQGHSGSIPQDARSVQAVNIDE